jgi:flagellar hook-associated protein FlgK
MVSKLEMGGHLPCLSQFSPHLTLAKHTHIDVNLDFIFSSGFPHCLFAFYPGPHMMEDHEDLGNSSRRPVPSHSRVAAKPTQSSAVSGRPSARPYLKPSPNRPQTSSKFPSAEYYSSGSDSDSEESDESSEEDFTSASTMEAAVAAKESIERFYKNFFQSLKERTERYVC